MLDKNGRPLERGDKVKFFTYFQGTVRGFRMEPDGQMVCLVENGHGGWACYQNELRKIQLRNPNKQKRSSK